MIYLKIFRIQRKLILVRYGFIPFIIMYVLYPKNISVSELVFFHPLLNFFYLFGFKLFILIISVLTIMTGIYLIETYIGFNDLYLIIMRFSQVVIDVWLNSDS